MSVPPAGGYGTMSLIGLVGNGSFAFAPAANMNAVPPARMMNSRRCMGLSSCRVSRQPEAIIFWALLCITASVRCLSSWVIGGGAEGPVPQSAYPPRLSVNADILARRPCAMSDLMRRSRTGSGNPARPGPWGVRVVTSSPTRRSQANRHGRFSCAPE